MTPPKEFLQQYVEVDGIYATLKEHLACGRVRISKRHSTNKFVWRSLRRWEKPKGPSWRNLPKRFQLFPST